MEKGGSTSSGMSIKDVNLAPPQEIDPGLSWCPNVPLTKKERGGSTSSGLSIKSVYLAPAPGKDPGLSRCPKALLVKWREEDLHPPALSNANTSGVNNGC